jgi:putative MATE family efflux protein
MATERVGVLLWRFSGPAMVAMVVNALYNVVDRLYIGQGVGRDAIAGLTLTLPYMTVLAAFGMLVGIGSGALVSIRLGQGRHDEAEQVLGQAVALFCALFAVLPAIALATLDATLLHFGGTATSIPYARDYLSVILYGNLFTHISFGMSHLMRAEGSAKRAMKAMLLGGVANLLLDPLFIFGFGLGIRGAAWATVLSMMLSSLYVLRHFTGTHCIVRLRLRNIRIRPRLAFEALSIGLSPFFMQLVASAVFVVFTRTIRPHAPDEVQALNATAAIGIVNGIALLLLMPIFGLSQGVQPIIGFNYGAQRFDRVREAYWLAAKVATLFCTIGTVVVQVAAPWIVRAFTRDASLLLLAVPALRRMTLAFPVNGVPIMTGTYFQSVGRPRTAILLSLLRQALVLIPLLLLLPRWFGLSGIWYAMPASDFCAAVIVAFVIFHEMRRLRTAHA